MKLKDLGIDHNQSARWQKEAEVPEKVFDQYIAMANRLGKDISAQGLLRIARASNGRMPRNGDRVDGRQVVGQGTADVIKLEEDSPDAILRELQNHRELLERILTPLCERDSHLKAAEKRMVVRLLTESEQLISLLLKRKPGRRDR